MPRNLIPSIVNPTSHFYVVDGDALDVTAPMIVLDSDNDQWYVLPDFKQTVGFSGPYPDQAAALASFDN